MESKEFESKEFITKFELTDISIGEMMDVYDDGKLRESRRYNAKIVSFIKLANINDTIKKLWDLNRDYWGMFYSEVQDIFIEAKTDENKDFVTSYFARTIDGGWFSLGAIEVDEAGHEFLSSFNSGRLVKRSDAPCEFCNLIQKAKQGEKVELECPFILTSDGIEYDDFDYQSCVYIDWNYCPKCGTPVIKD